MVDLKEEDPVHGLESLTTSKLLFILSLFLSLSLSLTLARDS